MRYKHPTLFAANLLAYLEATSLGLVDGSEEERQRASRIAATVAQTESRNWRAHRRPSPGRSRSMRRMGLSLPLVVLTALCLAGPAEAGVGPGETPGCGGSRCGTPAHPAPALLWEQELKPVSVAIVVALSPLLASPMEAGASDPAIGQALAPVKPSACFPGSSAPPAAEHANTFETPTMQSPDASRTRALTAVFMTRAFHLPVR